MAVHKYILSSNHTNETFTLAGEFQYYKLYSYAKILQKITRKSQSHLRNLTGIFHSGFYPARYQNSCLKYFFFANLQGVISEINKGKLPWSCLIRGNNKPIGKVITDALSLRLDFFFFFLHLFPATFLGNSDKIVWDKTS